MSVREKWEQYSAKYWRERASEARALAEQMSDPMAKETMYRIAHAYEDLARRAEGRPDDSQKSD